MSAYWKAETTVSSTVSRMESSKDEWSVKSSLAYWKAGMTVSSMVSRMESSKDEWSVKS